MRSSRGAGAVGPSAWAPDTSYGGYTTGAARRKRNSRHVEPHLPQLAANLRAAREAAGISQVALSRLSGVDLSHINNLENAHRDPTTGMLLRLARALGTTPSALLDGIE